MSAPLGLVVLSPDWSRAHYALMMASSAAAIDRPVIVFATMEAVPLLLDREGWRSLAGADRDHDLKRLKVADTEMLIEACGALGVTFMVCEAGLRATDIEPDLLRRDPPVEVTGLVTFYRAVGDGQIVVL